jgi:hypothetical protein
MGRFEDLAKGDFKTITSNVDGWGTAIKVSTPDGLTSVDIVGLAIKHHIQVDSEGLAMNGKNAHVSISEEVLTDAGYTVRVSEEVRLENHTVEWKDSTGIDKKYVIREVYPDEKVGLLVCILGDFED